MDATDRFRPIITDVQETSISVKWYKLRSVFDSIPATLDIQHDIQPLPLGMVLMPFANTTSRASTSSSTRRSKTKTNEQQRYQLNGINLILLL